MMTIRSLHDWARQAARSDDTEVSQWLLSQADARAAAARESYGRGPGWASAADIPDGALFHAATDPLEHTRGETDLVVFRKDGESCLLQISATEVLRPFDIDYVDHVFDVDRVGFVPFRWS